MAPLARPGIFSARLLAPKQCSVNYHRSIWARHVWARPGATCRTTNFSTTAQCNHSWEPSSSLSLDGFLRKFRPSRVANDGSAPSIWVRRLEQKPLDSIDLGDNHSNDPTVKRSKEILEEYTKKVVAVRQDKAIPPEGDAEKGIRSKVEIREELRIEATEKLDQLVKESKMTSGKWLFFLPSKYLDRVFESLARDLVSGSLSKTPAFALKVATSPVKEGPRYPHLICLYLPDIYDKAAMTEVLRVACKSAGVRPNSAKSDLYSLIGLTRNHPSGIKSTIWNATGLVPETELKELTELYWRDVDARRRLKATHKDKPMSVETSESSA